MGRGNSLQKLQSGTYGKGGEVLDWTYYDTLKMVAATTVYRMFQAPLSSSRTLDETNMLSAGMIPQGQKHVIRALQLNYTTAGAFATLDIQSFYTALKKTVVEFIIPGKDTMGQWPLMQLLGAATLCAETPTAAGDNIPIIQPRYHGIMPLNTPIRLAALTPFEIRVTAAGAAFAAALADDLIWIGLVGTLRRSS